MSVAVVMMMIIIIIIVVIIIRSVEVGVIVAVKPSGIMVVVLLESPGTLLVHMVEVVMVLLDRVFTWRLRIRMVLVPVVLFHFLHLKQKIRASFRKN